MSKALIYIKADSSTIVLNGTAIMDTAAGDMITLAPVNAHTARVHGSNKITGISERGDADVYDITINVMKYSDSDVYLNSLLKANEVITGSIKESYTKNGTNMSSSWSIEHGSFTTKPTDTRNNQDGNMQVSYTIQARMERSL